MFTHTLKPIIAGWLAAILLSTLAPVRAQDPTPLVTRQEAPLIAVLQSGASVKDKMDACRELSVIGTTKAVPALVSLLGDSQLSHMARYALETMPGAAVDTALRDHLNRVQGLPRVGVIGSLGVRRDAKAVTLLQPLLSDSEPLIADAAARALGSIGSPAAVKALRGAWSNVPSSQRLSVAEGLFRAAETLSKDGKKSDAIAVYELLRGATEPHQVKAGALRALIIARGKEGGPLLRQALRENDLVLFMAGLRAASEALEPALIKVMTDELPRLAPDRQILVSQILGRSADPGAMDALGRLARQGDTPARLAAIKAIAEINLPGAVPVVQSLLRDSDAPVANAAQEAFASLSVKGVDEAILQLLAPASPAADRKLALDLIGRRRMYSAVPILMSMTSDTDVALRQTTIKRLGELAGPAQFPALLDLLVKSEGGDLSAVEQSVASVARRSGQPQALTSQIVLKMAGAKPPQAAALLGVLGAIGGEEALRAVAGRTETRDAEVRTAAIRALATWPTADAAPFLRGLVRSSEQASDRALSLRSYLGWVSNTDVPAPQRLAMCREISPLVREGDERKAWLGALGSIRSLESLELAQPYLAQAGTRAEAAALIVNLSAELLKGEAAKANAPKVLESLQKAAEAEGNSELGRRAQAAVERARSLTK